MKIVAFLLILFYAVLSASSQNIPWFTESNAFKELVISKEIKSIVALHPDYQTFEEIKNLKKSYSYRTFSLNKVEYFFNKNGEIDKVQSSNSEITIELKHPITETEYDFIINELPKLPYPLTLKDSNSLRRYGGSTGLSNFKIHNMQFCIDSSGILFANLWNNEENKKLNFKYSCSYRLNRITAYQNGKFKSNTDYSYYGDFWIPNYAITYFCPINDSISILKTDAVIDTYDDDYDIPMGAKDTSFFHSYFVNNSTITGNRTEGVYTDSLQSNSYVPIRISKSRLKNNQKIDIQTIINIENNSIDFKLLPTSVYASFIQNNCTDSFDETDPYSIAFSPIFCGELMNVSYKTINKNNGKNKGSKQIVYTYYDEQWLKYSKEIPMNNGRRTTYYAADKKLKYSTHYLFDKNGYLTINHVDRNKSRVRLSMNAERIIAEQNFNYATTQYLIKY
jgi:hypothetical protein